MKPGKVAAMERRNLIGGMEGVDGVDGVDSDEMMEDDDVTTECFEPDCEIIEEPNECSVNKKTASKVKWNEKWKNEFTWLEKQNEEEGKCTTCDILIRFSYRGRSSLTRHGSSKSHQKMCTVAQKDITDDDIYAVSRAEAAITYQWVHHNLPYNALGSLIDVLKETVTDSAIVQQMHLKRTKATKIVENVIGPASIEEHLNNLKDGGLPFGLQIDASNMHGNKKLFPIVIFYWKKGLHFFALDLIETAEESSDSIWDMVTAVLMKYDLNIELLSAFNGDNASVNFGRHHSVFKHASQNNEGTLKGTIITTLFKHH